MIVDDCHVPVPTVWQIICTNFVLQSEQKMNWKPQNLVYHCKQPLTRRAGTLAVAATSASVTHTARVVDSKVSGQAVLHVVDAVSHLFPQSISCRCQLFSRS